VTFLLWLAGAGIFYGTIAYLVTRPRKRGHGLPPPDRACSRDAFAEKRRR
jgi:hypothetical protein